MWLLDLDEEVSALRRASRRRVRVDAAEQLSVFAAESHRRLSMSRQDARWDVGGTDWDAEDAWLLRDLPATSSSTHSLFARVRKIPRKIHFQGFLGNGCAEVFCACVTCAVGEFSESR